MNVARGSHRLYSLELHAGVRHRDRCDVLLFCPSRSAPSPSAHPRRLCSGICANCVRICITAIATGGLPLGLLDCIQEHIRKRSSHKQREYPEQYRAFSLLDGNQAPTGGMFMYQPCGRYIHRYTCLSDPSGCLGPTAYVEPKDVASAPLRDARRVFVCWTSDDSSKPASQHTTQVRNLCCFCHVPSLRLLFDLRNPFSMFAPLRNPIRLCIWCIFHNGTGSELWAQCGRVRA